MTLEVFRKKVYPLLTRRGVSPPVEGSDQEKALFEEWLLGLQKLQKLTGVGQDQGIAPTSAEPEGKKGE